MRLLQSVVNDGEDEGEDAELPQGGPRGRLVHGEVRDGPGRPPHFARGATRALECVY